MAKERAWWATCRRRGGDVEMEKEGGLKEDGRAGVHSQRRVYMLKGGRAS